MRHHPAQTDPVRTPLGLLAGTLLLLSPAAAFSMDPCENLRRDCMDYCRYQNPMMDHRECKRECRSRIKECRGGGMAGPMGGGYPGARGRSEKTEPDFRGMPEVGAYRGGGPGYGQGGPGYGRGGPGYGQGYGYPAGQYPQRGYPAAGAPAAQPQGAPAKPQGAPPAASAPAQPVQPQQGQTGTAPAPSAQPPAQPAAQQHPGYGYPPAGGYPAAPHGQYGYPGYGRPY